MYQNDFHRIDTSITSEIDRATDAVIPATKSSTTCSNVNMCKDSGLISSHGLNYHPDRGVCPWILVWSTLFYTPSKVDQFHTIVCQILYMPTEVYSNIFVI